MKNLLLIRRIQTDFEWDQDCYNIAAEVVAELNYQFPYEEYTELLIESLGGYIAEREIFLSEPIDLYDLFDEVFMQGFGYALKRDEKSNYFEFELNEEDIDKINNLIESHIKLYYKTTKKELINRLSLLEKNIIIIYSKKFYLEILKRFYNHDYTRFQSSFNNDDECINECLKKLSITDYKIIKI